MCCWVDILFTGFYFQKDFELICASRKVNLAFENVERRKKEGISHENATNMTSIELASAADAHGRAFLIQATYESVQEFVKQVPPALAEVIQDLVTLYAVDASLRFLGDLLRVSV